MANHNNKRKELERKELSDLTLLKQGIAPLFNERQIYESEKSRFMLNPKYILMPSEIVKRNQQYTKETIKNYQNQERVAIGLRLDKWYRILER